MTKTYRVELQRDLTCYTHEEVDAKAEQAQLQARELAVQKEANHARLFRKPSM